MYILINFFFRDTNDPLQNQMVWLCWRYCFNLLSSNLVKLKRGGMVYWGYGWIVLQDMNDRSFLGLGILGDNFFFGAMLAGASTSICSPSTSSVPK